MLIEKQNGLEVTQMIADRSRKPGYFLLVLLFLMVSKVFATQVETPMFSHPEGKYTRPVALTIFCNTPDADIYYTLDGSQPTTASIQFDDNPVIISQHACGDSLTFSGDNDPTPDDNYQPITYFSAKLRAIAVKDGMENSAVAKADYVVDLVDSYLNIPYAGPPANDGGKHLLDVYRPSGKQNTPVILFVHGGAWRQGDKSLYMELGNTFAGYYNFTTVVVNYQLSTEPWNAIHPTHIKDVALAYNWVIENIADYGGDVNNIYLFGQSAGGHLTSLLVTDTLYVSELGKSIQNVQSVISMSGAYDLYDLVQFPFNPLGLTTDEVLMYKTLCLNTFGGWEEDVVDDASPANYLHSNVPDFLIIKLEETDTFKDMPGFSQEALMFYDDLLALEKPDVLMKALKTEDIPAEILNLDFPGDFDAHYQEIYAINTKYWNSVSAQMVAHYVQEKPAIVQLLSPENNAVLQTTENVSLTWNSGIDATYYQLRIMAKTAIGKLDTLREQFVGDTLFVFNNLAAETNYCWQVQSVSALGHGAWSELREFNTKTTTGVFTEQGSLPLNHHTLIAYPNPFNSTVRINTSLTVECEQSAKVSIFNILGKLVYKQKIQLENSTTSFTWNPDATLNTGVYLVHVKFGNEQIVGKILYLK